MAWLQLQPNIAQPGSWPGASLLGMSTCPVTGSCLGLAFVTSPELPAVCPPIPKFPAHSLFPLFLAFTLIHHTTQGRENRGLGVCEHLIRLLHFTGEDTIPVPGVCRHQATTSQRQTSHSLPLPPARTFTLWPHMSHGGLPAAGVSEGQGGWTPAVLGRMEGLWRAEHGTLPP